eukprot:jgi/Botrbrau1/10285/Bobra.0120s0007.1
MPAGLCAKCKSPAPYRCKQCSAVGYCSEACQKVDWRVHKVYCKMNLDVPRPVSDEGPAPVRAFLLPQNLRTPEVVYVPFVKFEDGWVPNVKSVFPRGTADISRRMTEVEDKNGKSYWVTIWFDDNFRAMYHEPSASVVALSRGRNEIFRGPQLAVKTGLFGSMTTNFMGQPIPEVEPDYVDMELSDMPEVAAFFTQSRNLE